MCDMPSHAWLSKEGATLKKNNTRWETIANVLEVVEKT